MSKDIPINDHISLLGTPVSPEGHTYFPEAHLYRSRASVTPLLIYDPKDQEYFIIFICIMDIYKYDPREQGILHLPSP